MENQDYPEEGHEIVLIGVRLVEVQTGGTGPPIDDEHDPQLLAESRDGEHFRRVALRTERQPEWWEDEAGRKYLSSVNLK